MPEVVNTSFLGANLNAAEDGQTKTMVNVDGVSMVFNMAAESLNSLKEYAIALARKELRFKEFRALDNISLEVKQGDVFGILGTNGSGKSTLLKIIAGVLEPSEGSCSVNGSIAPLIELGAGFDMDLTARENIYLNGALLGYSKAFIDEHFEEIVRFAEVEQFLDMPMKNYSSGMVARVAFAIATVVVPEILIVDEVLSVGDFMFQQKCERRINTLIQEHGVTVLIVSHDHNLIERLCNKAVWIEKGHMRMLGTAQEVCQTYRILGGHTGSAEAEQTVYGLINAEVEIPAGTITSLGGETRYGTAVNLFEHCFGNQTEFETLIVASGEDLPSALLASNLAAAKHCPILLTKQEELPDITASTIKHASFGEVVVVGSKDIVSAEVCQRLEALTGVCPQRIDLFASYKIADEIYTRYLQGSSRTAVLTYPTCTGDLLSLSPYMAQEKTPLFFNVDDGIIGEETFAHLTQGAFDRVLLLGGMRSFPEETVEPLRAAGLEVVRFCGKNPVDANHIINNWIDENRGTARNALVVASVNSPVDALTIAPFAQQNCVSMLLEDPQDLDSVARAFTYIESAGGAIEKLYFLGNSSTFNALDKELLAKKVILQAHAQ
jgi:ABC-2 type transport system ATP-binding protein